MRQLAVSTLAFCSLLLPVTATPVFSESDSGQAPLTDTDTFPTDNNIAEDVFYPTDNSDTFYLNTDTDTDADTTMAPSWFTSTLMARRLLALSTTGVASTIFPSPLPGNSHAPAAVAGHSISLKEYFADCDEALPHPTGHGGDGNPTILALNVATTFRNTAAGSNISLSIDWWDHVSETDPLFPGFPRSAAGLPRVTLFGYIEPFETPMPRVVEEKLRECYTGAHPDSKVWLPGRKMSPHSSFWARLVVTQVYWIGGFGGFQQIGWMNVSDWRGIRRGGSDRGIGDGSGRGWEDVRLPGEK